MWFLPSFFPQISHAISAQAFITAYRNQINLVSAVWPLLCDIVVFGKHYQGSHVYLFLFAHVHPEYSGIGRFSSSISQHSSHVPWKQAASELGWSETATIQIDKDTQRPKKASHDSATTQRLKNGNQFQHDRNGRRPTVRDLDGDNMFWRPYGQPPAERASKNQKLSQRAPSTPFDGV